MHHHGPGICSNFALALKFLTMKNTASLHRVVAAALIVQTTVQAAEFILQPVSATGPHWIHDSQIRLKPGGQRVFLEIQLRDFAPATLATYQAGLDGAGYDNLEMIDIGPASQRCPGRGDVGTTFCREAFDDPDIGGPRCIDVDFDSPKELQCQAGWINETRTDWLMAGHLALAVVDISTDDFRYGAALVLGNEVVDDGSLYYIGSLAVDVPPGARGTFTLGFLADESFLANRNGQAIEPLLLTPAQIIILCTDDFDCWDGNSCTIDRCDARTHQCIYRNLGGPRCAGGTDANADEDWSQGNCGTAHLADDSKSDAPTDTPKKKSRK